MGKDFYSDKITEVSFNELAALAEWMNKQSKYLVVVGGWAVWCYTKGLGSRDIDIILQDDSKNIILTFFKEYNYSEGEEGFFKAVKAKEGMEKIFIDIISSREFNRLKEDMNINVPWNWALKYSNDFELKPNIFIKIPKIEVVLIYKAKAVLDRLQTLEGIPESNYFQNKVFKDFYDIASILEKCEVDLNFLKKLLNETMFEKYFCKSLKLLKERNDILAEFDALEKIKKILKELE